VRIGRPPAKTMMRPPIRAGGALAGGLGVSGAASAVDRACAEAGLRAAGLDLPE